MDEPAPDWWRTWFGPAYLSLYDDYLAERTPIEVDRLEVLLALRPPARILGSGLWPGSPHYRARPAWLTR